MLTGRLNRRYRDGIPEGKLTENSSFLLASESSTRLYRTDIKQGGRLRNSIQLKTAR